MGLINNHIFKTETFIITSDEYGYLQYEWTIPESTEFERNVISLLKHNVDLHVMYDKDSGVFVFYSDFYKEYSVEQYEGYVVVRSKSTPRIDVNNFFQVWSDDDIHAFYACDEKRRACGDVFVCLGEQSKIKFSEWI